MTLYIKGTDLAVVGTREKLTGLAQVIGLEDDGSITFGGETEVDWNEQETIIHNGRPIWVVCDEEGDLSDYYDVEVEDRRADGTVVLHTALHDDPVDDLMDLLNQSYAKAAHVLTQPITKEISATVEVVKMHLERIATGLQKTVDQQREQDKDSD